MSKSGEFIRIRRTYGPASLPLIDWQGSREFSPPPLEANFIPFAQANSPDILITNGKCEFECHKAILQMLSTTVADILDGDSNAIELPLNDISNGGLRWLCEFIYAVPIEKRTRDGLLKKMTRMPSMSIDFEVQADILTLIGKYNFKLVHEFAREYFGPFYTLREFKSTGTKIFNLINMAESFKLHDLEKLMKESFEGCWMELSGSELQKLPIHTLHELVKKIEFDEEEVPRVYFDLINIALEKKDIKMIDVFISRVSGSFDDHKWPDKILKGMVLNSLDVFKKMIVDKQKST